MSYTLVIQVSALETSQELLRWEDLSTQATARGVQLPNEAFKRSLCDEVCKDLLKHETDPFVSRGQFWLLVHQKAATLWLGESEASRFATRWADEGKISFWCGVYGETPCSQQYVEFWVREKNWAPKKPLDDEVLKALDGRNHHILAPHGLVVKAVSRNMAMCLTFLITDVVLAGSVVAPGVCALREARRCHPQWENSSDRTAIIEAVQQLMPDKDNETLWALEEELPQRIWGLILGETWEEIGNTLHSTAVQLGVFPNQDGTKTPLFQLQLRLDHQIKKSKEWVGVVSLRWDTTIAAAVADPSSTRAQLARTAAFLRVYWRTVRQAHEEEKTFSRLDRCAHWAMLRYPDLLALPETFDLAAAAEINGEWTATHPARVGESHFDQVRAQKLAYVLFDMIDDRLPAVVQDCVAKVDIKYRVKALSDWVDKGGWEFYPVKGPRNRWNRRRWAGPAAGDAADAIWRSRYDDMQVALMEETDGEKGVR
ncbi:hypothetical protein PG997_015199 [Apiospora hydei]|uniref:Uncharacterized protein n=1 Tax=Apiospora hydei TaxID=1337664 RepID=A0ABR1UW18_9PEZI